MWVGNKLGGALRVQDSRMLCINGKEKRKKKRAREKRRRRGVILCRVGRDRDKLFFVLLKVFNKAVVLTILDNISNGDQPDTMLLGKGIAIIPTGHRSITIVDELADDGHRLELGQLAEINRGFGVTETTDGAAIGVAQGEDVAGSVKVLGGLGWVCQRAGGEGAVVGRDTGGCAVGVIDRDRVGRLPDILVIGHHQRQLELL